MKEKIMRKICRGMLFTIACVVVASLASVSKAVDNGIFLFDYTPMQYAAFNSLATSTHAVTGIGVGYIINPVGSTCSYHLSFTTATFINPTTHAVTPSVVVSSEATIPSGMVLSDTFKIAAFNPKITISGLATGATVFIWLDYGQFKTSWSGN